MGRNAHMNEIENEIMGLSEHSIKTLKLKSSTIDFNSIKLYNHIQTYPVYTPRFEKCEIWRQYFENKKGVFSN